jgi:hypothetical protein
MRFLLIAALALGLMAGAAPAAADPPAHGRSADDLMDDALRAIAMTRADLSFRTDYADHPDSFRIAVVDSLLDRPLDTEHYVVEVADRLADAGSLEDLVARSAAELDLYPKRPARSASDPPAPVDYAELVLDRLVPAIEEATNELEIAFVGLTEEQRTFIRENAPILLEEDEFDPDKPIDVKDREAEEEERLGDELLRIAGQVDYERIARAGRIVARAVDAAIPSVREWASASTADESPSLRGHEGLAHGDVLWVTNTLVGPVIVGGPGATTYRREAAVIIDLGGDDVYEGGAGGALGDRTAAIVIDAGGNDTYRSDHHSLGAGFIGVGVLVDLAGDDSYRAGSFSLGSGLFGVGILVDEDGNDCYAADTCTEGSGAFGIGVHVDRAGNDVYQAALFSQAFGFVEGLGVLLDGAGNDTYFAGGKYTDEIRYFDHFLSLSQGFGFGWRPDASGGVGLLVDRAGNDVYVSDIFGQGSSYWFAVGGLVDYAGNDQYVSYQYAQGAATHITVAALVDFEGDDNYVSKGVSQGCGHDLAIGILHDHAGDDNYTCHDLSQAAGNANGIGVLIDDAGDDAYSVRDPVNTHGYGNLRRDYGSVGVLIDAGGDDAYSGRGADGAWWSGSAYGIGIDHAAGEGGEGE